VNNREQSVADFVDGRTQRAVEHLRVHVQGDVDVRVTHQLRDDLCLMLSRLSIDEAQTAANHYHFADYMNSAEEGSVPVQIRIQHDL
jgi:hypothetical protein